MCFWNLLITWQMATKVQKCVFPIILGTLTLGMYVGGIACYG